ncbi:non-ribosomal peptide synthetase [Chryseobacterium sp. ON_d1]|uniref:non-ribosomal peptide synthetase n=1 Tax=Chryseobacterium sp. ON_d1 TaxID=2583211 RepID=UPI0011580AD2|nr:non-ribosomal peptide synthetase [Chryseobacterium sp. ON_d1]GEJ45764.1 hypothetical protein CRS_23720 [Chryseobacterium sp. ON_d1]
MKLTLPQQDIFFEQLLYPNVPIYNIGAKIEIKGEINFVTLQRAYSEMISQHDAYRSFIREKDGVADISIGSGEPRTLEFVDFSDKNDSVSEADKYMQEEFLQPFNILEDHFLYRFVLVKCHRNLYYLFSVYHHIITDGWGTSLMFQRLIKNYNNLLNFDEVQEQYPYEYKKFMDEDEVYQLSEAFQIDKLYWAERYSDLPQAIFTKKENASKNHTESERKELIIARKDYNRFLETGQKHNFSTFHSLLGILFFYLGRINHSDDLAIGIPVLNRNNKIFKKTVGLFMGVSPLRMKVNHQNSLLNLIEDTKKQLMSDYRHQRYPLGKIVQDLKLYNEKDKLFNITFSYEKHNYADHFEGTVTTVLPLTNKSERVALAIYVREFDEDENIKIDFDYNTAYFDEYSITQYTEHISHLIVNMEELADQPLKNISFLSEEEKQTLFSFNKKAAEITSEDELTFIDIFQRNVSVFPDKEAVTDGRLSLSYAEVDRISSRMAHFILNHYASEKAIAVLLNRSAHMICILLGIMKAGKAYLPLDPEFPESRLRYILEDSKAGILISDESIIAELENVKRISLDDIFTYNAGFCKSIAGSEDTAYVIYTSGSTGNPKGVEIGHTSLLNLLKSISVKPGMHGGDKLFSVTTYSFDISILEFFTPLINGATLYIATENILKDPGVTIEEMSKVKPTVIQATPSFFKRLISFGWRPDSALKILCGGDLLNNSLIEELIENCGEMWNMYGPTETTIWSSTKKIEKNTSPLNIGAPITETFFYILDADLNLLPINAMGDIYIGGKGLAKGYYNNERLTSERFIKNPFREGELMYKTGDIGQWNETGEIIFFGRSDHQVKINGYRIELGDIENQLNIIENIEDSVVVVKDHGGEKDLVAYIKIRAEIAISEIYDILSLHLPYYMVPQFIFSVEEFPLTPNKKIDRKLLSAQDLPSGPEGPDNRKIDNNQLIQSLKVLWKEVLHSQKDIQVEDNFFELGGHSILVNKLINLISKNFSVQISMKDVFENPDFYSLYRHILKRKNENDRILAAPVQDVYKATPTQQNIWLACQKREASPAFNMFMEFDISGNIDIVLLEKSVQKILSANEILRTNFILENDTVCQRISAPENVHFSLEINEAENELDYRHFVNQYISFCFDLEKDLLLKLMILKVGEKYKILFLVHHIIFDGISTETFIKQLLNFYNSSASVIQEDAEIQFKDYSYWYYQQMDFSKNQLFWEKYVEGYQYESFFKKEIPLSADYKGTIFTVSLDSDHSIRLADLAKEKKTTPYFLMLTALLILLQKISGKQDICIATVDSGRSTPQVQSILGVFIKSLLLRVELKEEPFMEILEKVTHEFLEVNKYEEISGSSFLKDNVDIMFVSQNPDFSYHTINGFSDFSIQRVAQNTVFNKFPVIMNVINDSAQVHIDISYNKSLYKDYVINDFSQAYIDFLKYILSLNSDLDSGYKDFFCANRSIDIDFDF